MFKVFHVSILLPIHSISITLIFIFAALSQLCFACNETLSYSGSSLLLLRRMFRRMTFFMDIEIIHNQSNDFCFRIFFGNENLHELCKILHCSSFGYLSYPFSALSSIAMNMFAVPFPTYS